MCLPSSSGASGRCCLAQDHHAARRGSWRLRWLHWVLGRGEDQDSPSNLLSPLAEVSYVLRKVWRLAEGEKRMRLNSTRNKTASGPKGTVCSTHRSCSSKVQVSQSKAGGYLDTQAEQSGKTATHENQAELNNPGHPGEKRGQFHTKTPPPSMPRYFTTCWNSGQSIREEERDGRRKIWKQYNESSHDWKKNPKYRWYPIRDGSTSHFFVCVCWQWCKSDTCSVECTSNFEFSLLWD